MRSLAAYAHADHLAAAVVVGTAIGALSHAWDAYRLNVLDNPLLDLLLWTYFVVFGPKVVLALVRRARSKQPSLPSANDRDAPPPFRESVLADLGQIHGRLFLALCSSLRVVAFAISSRLGDKGPVFLGTTARFAGQWFTRWRGVFVKRFVRHVHGVALGMVLGSVASLVIRALRHRYTVHFESTFLEPEAARGLMLVFTWPVSIARALVGYALHLIGSPMLDLDAVPLLAEGVDGVAGGWIAQLSVTLLIVAAGYRLSAINKCRLDAAQAASMVRFELKGYAIDRLLGRRPELVEMAPVEPGAPRPQPVTSPSAAGREVQGQRLQLRGNTSVAEGSESRRVILEQIRNTVSRATGRVMGLRVTDSPDERRRAEWASLLEELAREFELEPMDRAHGDLAHVTVRLRAGVPS